MVTSGRKRITVVAPAQLEWYPTLPDPDTPTLQSCAATLAKHPAKFDITLIDSVFQTGGQATSLPLDSSKYGASWLNDGVKGGSSILKHTFKFFRDYGYEPHEPEIKKLGRVLKVVKYGLPVIWILPVKVALKLFRFSTEFGNRMRLPLLALFLGTGNQTPNGTEVEVVHRAGDAVVLAMHTPDGKKTESFDYIVLCRQAPWKEKWGLGGVKFFDDVTVTHSDIDYFRSICETSVRDDLVFRARGQSASLSAATASKRQDQLAFASAPSKCEEDGWTGLNTMYYTHS
ncbi:hypothetical protein BDW75DRAFT_242037 [Aspergillus navahoensis]